VAISDLVFIDATGYNYEDYPSFLAYFTTSYQNIYGQDVYLGPDSQDGQWIAIQAQAAYDTAALGAAVYNSFSPATAQGVGLSRVVEINGIQRGIATYSTVELVIVGTAFTTIFNGIAVDTLQQQWALPATVTIPLSGTITVTATAVVIGALNAVPDSVSMIFTPTQGWQTVNNPAAATPGQPIQTDAQLRILQQDSVALPALTALEGTYAAVANVPGVIELRDYENYTDTTDSNGLPPHSISFVVEGGTDTAIAEAILLKKTPGTDTYGTTSVPLVDENGVPITINFFRPTNAVIAIQVTLTPLPSWISSNETIIANALATFINTMIPIGGIQLDQDTPPHYGISFSQLFAIAYVPGTSAAGSFIIESIELSKNGGGLAEADIDLLFDEIAVCDASTNVTFIV
jgi:uncharacterized phage protein gp47/JayE